MISSLGGKGGGADGSILIFNTTELAYGNFFIVPQLIDIP